MSLRSRTLATIVAGLLMMFGLTIGQAAHAHDQLVGSNPEEGAELDTQPEWLELTFSGEIQDVGTEIQVLNDDDENISAGEITVEGTSVSSALPDNLTPGEYTVQWRVVSSDGHPISGEFGFTLTDAVGAGEDGAAEGDEGDANGPAELGGAAVDQPEDGAQEQGALSEDADSGGMSTPMMILLVVGGLAIVVLVILLLTRKQKGLPGTPGNPEKPGNPETPDTK